MQVPPTTTTSTAPPIPDAATSARKGRSIDAHASSTSVADDATAPKVAHHHPSSYLPLHRVEALTDGIFAVAMTLLVIELKLPADHSIHSADALYQSLADLIVKAFAWINSFFVLSLFWIGHHRVFSIVRVVDGKLAVLNLLELAFVSLMPFTSMLIGEFGGYLISQIFYSLNMTLMSLTALAVGRHVHRHPELCSRSFSLGRYRAARMRLFGLILISAVAVVIGAFLPSRTAAGNMAFMLMVVIGPLSRRLEQRTDAAVARAAPG